MVVSRSGQYSVRIEDLDTYLIPKRPVELTADSIRSHNRGIGYTKPAFASLFKRIA